MSEPRNLQDMLVEAERAASAGDLVSAEELLREAARLQEAELGPLHPDLANTLNNLAVLAEKAARLDDAERLYRRAVAIASASLPPDDPMAIASRQNLEDFCRAHGRPIERPDVVEPAAREVPAHAPPAPTLPPPAPPAPTRTAPTLPAPARSAPTRPMPSASRKAPRPTATLAL